MLIFSYTQFKLHYKFSTLHILYLYKDGIFLQCLVPQYNAICAYLYTAILPQFIRFTIHKAKMRSYRINKDENVH